MQYGFIDYLGRKWPDSFVDTYNRYDAEVIKRDKPNLCAESKAELEFYRDQRHKQFIQLSELAQ